MKALQNQIIKVECGLQPHSESQASACTPKQNAAPEGSDAESAEQKTRAGRERLCSLCKKVLVVHPSTRCTPCNTLYNRICVYRKHMDKKSIDIWDKIDKDRKFEFIKHCQCRDLTRAELKCFMRKFVTSELQSQIRITLEDTSHFPELPDFNSKDTVKLEHLQTPKANAKKGMNDREAEETRGEKRMMYHSPEKSIRPTKKEKGARNTTVVYGAGDKTKLDERQTKQVDEWVTFLENLEARIQRLKVKNRELHEWIAPIKDAKLNELQIYHNTTLATDRLDQLQLLHTQGQAHCNEIKLSGECLDFHTFIRYMKSIKEAFNSESTTIDEQVQEAQTAFAFKINKSPEGRSKGSKKK